MGTGCGRITSKEECERAAEALGLSDTTAVIISKSNAPYCFNYVQGYGLKYNTEGDLKAQCSSNRECLCKGKGKLFVTQLFGTLHKVVALGDTSILSTLVRHNRPHTLYSSPKSLPVCLHNT